MNPLRWLFRWVLFIIRNGGRNPEYPFMDDGVEQPLELRIGPWGSTKWYDPSDGDLHDVTTIDGLVSIAESMERDIYGYTHKEVVAEAERQEQIRNSYKCPPRVIGFSARLQENTR